MAVLKIVAFEAGEAVSILSVSGTLVRNGDADVLSIENPLD